MLDNLYGDIVHIISTASDKCLPRSKAYKQCLKLYWNVSLNELHDAMKAKRLIKIGYKVVDQEVIIMNHTNNIKSSVHLGNIREFVLKIILTT